jgi:hypothetical protein
MFIGRQALLGSLYKTYWYKVYSLCDAAKHLSS